ncbi:MAG: hypothetical protein P8172_04750 [Gammaproteobacteria bacterium]|jgi:hypothetical protein
MTFRDTRIERDLPAEVRKWLEEEAAEQEERYRRIVEAMEALDPTRDQWYEEFFERIRRHGFNVDGDQRVQIPEHDLPVRPDRKHKVVY